MIRKVIALWLFAVVSAPGQWTYFPLDTTASAIVADVYWDTNALTELVSGMTEVLAIQGETMALRHTEAYETNLVYSRTWYTQLVASAFTDVTFNGVYEGPFFCTANNPPCLFGFPTDWTEYYVHTSGAAYIFRESFETGTFWASTTLISFFAPYTGTTWVGSFYDYSSGTVEGVTSSGGADSRTYTNVYRDAYTITNGVPRFPDGQWWGDLAGQFSEALIRQFINADYDNWQSQWFGVYSSTRAVYPQDFPRYRGLAEYGESIGTGHVELSDTNEWGQVAGSFWYLVASNAVRITMHEERNHPTDGETILDTDDTWSPFLLGLNRSIYSGKVTMYITALPGTTNETGTYNVDVVGLDMTNNTLSNAVSVSYFGTSVVSGIYRDVTDLVVTSWLNTGDVLSVWMETDPIPIYSSSLSLSYGGDYPSRHAYNQLYELISGPLHYTAGGTLGATTTSKLVNFTVWPSCSDTNYDISNYNAANSVANGLWATGIVHGFPVGMQAALSWSPSGCWVSPNLNRKAEYHSALVTPLGTNWPFVGAWGTYTLEWDQYHSSSDANEPGSTYWRTRFSTPNAGRTNERQELIQNLSPVAATSRWAVGDSPFTQPLPSGGGPQSTNSYTIDVKWRVDQGETLNDYSGIRTWD